jgi:hypothetical protein
MPIAKRLSHDQASVPFAGVRSRSRSLRTTTACAQPTPPPRGRGEPEARAAAHATTAMTCDAERSRPAGIGFPGFVDAVEGEIDGRR